MSKSVLLHYNLVNATLVRETDKAVLIKCEKLALNNNFVSIEQWFPKSQIKNVNGTWQLKKGFMRTVVMELGTSLNAQEIW